ncbi:MAG: AmmeMemoRadiSam system protein B [Phycisphaerae bacterium]|nr:AmmeMemoRadiSam system protein B [Phycisphaerae bacterium]
MSEPTTTADHLLRPHARPVQPMPVQNEGKQFIALRDPSMLVQQTMLVPPQAMGVLQFFDGSLSIDDIASRLIREDDPERQQNLERAATQVAGLAEQMDKFGLLWGPTFEGFEKQIAEKLNETGAFPPRASISLVQIAHQSMGGSQPPEEQSAQAEWAQDLASRQLQAWLEDAEDPEFDQPVIGLVVPHLDYPRGSAVYAGGYRAWVDTPAPDRVVVLGTNHFGLGDGVIMSNHGFDTPLGRVSPDTTITAALRQRLGDRLFKDQLDLLPEHSIELHLPWIQHLFGDVPVVAALLPDPLQPMIADDGERVSYEEFIAALKASLDEAGGRTFFVSSADLSHVGPNFGEPKPVDDARRVEVERHDREHLAKFITNDTTSFLEAMEWCKNPTRWCSIGNMTATAALAQPAEIELVDYRQAVDDQGTAMVSVAAIALLSD